MIEKNGTGIQMSEISSTRVEKSGTGIGRRGSFRALVEKNGTGIRALSGSMMLLAMSIATASIAQERASGYVIVEGEQVTISINNPMFSSSGQAAVFEGYSAIPMKIIDARQLDLRFAAMNPLSEGSGTGRPDSEGSGTGRPESEGSGTGSPLSEGSGTGRPNSEGSGTGSPLSEGSGTGRVNSEGSGTGRVASEGSGTGKPLSEGSGTGRLDSEGSGTGRVASEGSGTGRVASEGSGTGRVASEGSGTGSPASEGSGTGSPEAFAIDVCISGGRMSSQACDTAPGGQERPMVVDGFAEVVIEGQMAFVLVHQLNADGSLSELATMELPVLEQ